MNSRERLLRCIKGEPIDRVPISTYELCGYNYHSWENHETSYKQLMDLIREKTDCMLMVDAGQYNPAYEGIVKGESTKEGNKTTSKSWIHTPKGVLTRTYQFIDNVHTSWCTEHLLKTLDDIETYLSIDSEHVVVDFNPVINAQKELGENGIVLVTLGDPICQAADLFSMEDFLVYAMTDTDTIKDFLDELHRRGMKSLKQMLTHNVKDVMFRICGPEYGTPPYLPPYLFEELVTPYLQDMCKVIKEAGGIPRIHSHGKVRHALEQFALTDAMCIDPLEPIPDGDISLKEVKEKYGDRFCLMGNIELKELEHSTTSRIDALVKEAMDAAKEGGRFILMPTAAPIDVPLRDKTLENYIKFIESGLKYGRY